ncbi:MAG: hypothetical protein HYV95_16690 [Opitutae bacterium]|nr:hypothetical protein [Opitutae bacterium]
MAPQAKPPPIHPPTRAAARLRAGVVGFGLLLAVPGAFALKPTERFDLKELESEPNMTPGHFADLFEDFAYDYYPYVQAPDTFLQTRSGDCDDYAILADYILSRRNFKTRLIRVELVGTRINHAVCYVMEKKVYLDFNNRKYAFNLERSSPSIREIATKVADSFEKNWTSATEYTYSYAEGRQRAVRTVVKTDPPERDPDRPANR